VPRRQLRTPWRALPADHAERAALKQQVKIAAAIAAELESLLGLGDGYIGKRVTDRINIMTFACNYA
jgi:hypothetical protein